MRATGPALQTPQADKASPLLGPEVRSRFPGKWHISRQAIRLTTEMKITDWRERLLSFK
jgi:hypothetical protein